MSMVDPFEATAFWATELFPRKDEVGVNALAAVTKVARAAIENFIVLLYWFVYEEGLDL